MLKAQNARLGRLFRPSGGCLDVAVDHGVFNEYSFLEGLEHLETVVAALVAAGADALQMNYGQADLLQRIPGREKPALVLRVDAGNPYNQARHASMWDVLVSPDDPVLPAVRVDAACVVANLLLVEGEPALHRQTVENAGRLRAACDRYAMPMMIEPLVMKWDPARGRFAVDGDRRKVVALVRQARELGADIIKADPTCDPADYHEVVQAARCPVLVRGGGKEAVEAVFEKAHAYLAQGARGLVYGRNIFQHPNPSRIVRSFLGLIHEGWTAQQAWQAYSAE